MNILSLFDGMSCGQIAVSQLFGDYNYYASEIDKWAIKITQKNFPNTVQLGSVENWSDWNLPEIDLLIGGSPCQGFSFAGKQLNFEDPRSQLFFKYVEVLNHYKPKYFLLENVRMSKASQDVISEALGVEPVMINSALVSAQNRNRLYWSNIPITQPEDRGIMLKDIIEEGFVTKDKSILLRSSPGGLIRNNKFIRQVVWQDKSYTIDANYFKGGNLKSFLKGRRQLVLSPQSARRIHVYNKDGFRKLTVLECERLQTVPEGYSEGVSNSQRYKMLGNGFTVDVIKHILRGIT